MKRQTVSGLLACALLAAVVLLARISTATPDTFTVTADFDTVGGSIASGADVKLRGYVIGEVTDVRKTDGGVALDLSLKPLEAALLPADVAARILPATVFGTTYVDLVAETSQAPRLQPGASIAQDRSTPTLELQRALDGIDQLVSALGPAKLSTVLHAISSSLDGAGDRIGASAEGLGRVADGLRPQVPVLRDDLRLLARNLKTFKQLAPSLLDSIDDTVVVADDLVEHRVDVTDVIDSALRLVDDSGNLLDATDERFRRNVIGAAVLIDALFDNREGLTQGPRSLDALLRRAMTVTDGGVIRIDATVVDANAHDYYTPEDCPRYETANGANCR